MNRGFPGIEPERRPARRYRLGEGGPGLFLAANALEQTAKAAQVRRVRGTAPNQVLEDRDGLV